MTGHEVKLCACKPKSCWSASQTAAYTEDAKLIKPADPTKAHYDFGGWYADEGLKTSYSFSTAAAGNVTLYAKWTAKRYTLTFDSNGGSSVAAQTVAYAPDAVFTAPALAPTKADHRFAGWFTGAALTSAYDFSSRVTGSIKLFAKWLYVQVIDQAITYSNGVNAHLDDFGSPAQTKKAFTDALSAAKTVRDGAKAQKEIDDAAKALNAAALDLRLEATSENLEALKGEKTSLKAQTFQDAPKEKTALTRRQPIRSGCLLFTGMSKEGLERYMKRKRFEYMRRKKAAEILYLDPWRIRNSRSSRDGRCSEGKYFAFELRKGKEKILFREREQDAKRNDAETDQNSWLCGKLSFDSHVCFLHFADPQ